MASSFYTSLLNMTPYAGMLAPVLIISGALAIDRKRREQLEKPPQTEKLLRSPGHSLSEKLDQITEAIILTFGICALFGLLAAAFTQWASVSWGNISASASLRLAFSTAAVTFAALVILAAIRVTILFFKAKNYSLGLQGERAVAQALYEAAADSGYRIYHDIQTDHIGNIDHVAVGLRGVFVIETKARRRRSNTPNQSEHEVKVRKKTLHFPTGFDDKAISQAERNAAWLKDYLRRELHQQIPVTPIVVLPGWFVTYAEPERPVHVTSAKGLITHLARPQPALDPEQFRAISAALDKLCRNIEF